MPNIKKVAMLSIAAMLVQIGLSKLLYPVIGKTTTQLFAVEPVTGIGGQQLGTKLLGYLTGYVPLDLTSWVPWIAMFIGTFALVAAGMWIYEQNYVRVWQGRNLSQRLFAMLLYGHAVLYILLLVLKWGTVPNLALNLLLGLGINLMFVSAAIAASANYLKFPRI